MPNLFGLDIKTMVAQQFAGQLVDGTLTKSTPGTRDSGNLTAGTQPTSTAYTFEGVVTEYNAFEISSGLAERGDLKVLIIAGSMSTAGVEPSMGDLITIESKTLTLLDLSLIHI